MLDREGPVPLYVQVAEVLRERIAGGEFGVGDALPSEAALEEEFGIGRTTARNAARELRRRGLAHTVRGEGTFVGPAGVPRVKPSRALYVPIAAAVAARITRGELRPGRAVPDAGTLSRHYGVARVTARQAVALLVRQGWAVETPPRGVRVADPSAWPRELAPAGEHPLTSVLLK
ncbi:GntR family transcriptional regulator [Nonomuraea salmonea]|uniref:GntR family transcriptional regulator n=1 Tax=Nonomuraea salmonea TaxID=46181 RepID=A0ABV5NQW7_9ACTN